VTLEPGRQGRATLVVGEEDTAVALGSGDLAVLATPRVVLLAEQACVDALAGALGDDTTTVGHRIELNHVAPVPVGTRVQADAVLAAVEGRRLAFRVTVSDDRGLVAAGRVVRVVVERARFLEKVAGGP
jgi:predicted thioesterase